MDIRAHYLFNNQYRAFYVVNDILADTAGNKGRKCTFAAVAHNNEVYAFFFSVFGNEIAWCAQDSDFIMFPAASEPSTGTRIFLNSILIILLMNSNQGKDRPHAR